MGRQMKLKDQVAIVTGAGRNIGEEIAKLFAAEGAKVAIVDVDKPRGERVVGASASTRAALFARWPISCIRAAMLEPSTVLSGAAMATIAFDSETVRPWGEIHVLSITPYHVRGRAARPV